MSLDVGIVGAGIVGLAHAWSAAERGHRVTVFEKSPQAAGASIRNFGMVWPIGQPAGARHQTALVSRDRWLTLATRAGVWVNPCGSIHLAHRDDEWAVLEEFASIAPALGYDCRLLTPTQVLGKTPAANPQGLRGGLFSPAELGVNPRTAVRALPGWLQKNFGVTLLFESVVTQVQSGRLQLADGLWHHFDRIIVCGGAEIDLLYPHLRKASGLKRCKLQMLRTRPQPSQWRLGPHLASGLTLRHYANFDVCPSLDTVRTRIQTETPELEEFGIHVMASQNDEGSVILGDSHEYDDAIEPFDKTRIDALMLRELQRILVLPDWSLEEHWHGIYLKHPTREVVAEEPLPGVSVRTGTGGAGMTMSFGLAEREWASGT